MPDSGAQGSLRGVSVTSEIACQNVKRTGPGACILTGSIAGLNTHSSGFRCAKTSI